MAVRFEGLSLSSAESQPVAEVLVRLQAPQPGLHCFGSGNHIAIARSPLVRRVFARTYKTTSHRSANGVAGDYGFRAHQRTYQGTGRFFPIYGSVAQLVEQLPCKQPAAGSSPVTTSRSVKTICPSRGCAECSHWEHLRSRTYDPPGRHAGAPSFFAEGKGYAPV